PEAYLARGRAYLKLGQLNAAVDDFKLADKLRPTGQAQAALGHCYGEMGNHRWAVGCYREAIRRDFRTAVVLNNLGYSLMSDGVDAEAAQCFREAIQAGPRLQPAYYNLAKVELKKAWNGRDRISPEVVQDGLAAMAKAIELGPATAELH